MDNQVMLVCPAVGVTSAAGGIFIIYDTKGK